MGPADTGSLVRSCPSTDQRILAMQPASVESCNKNIKHRFTSTFSLAAILLGTSLTAATCSNSTGPVPNLSGSWRGGSPVQLSLAFEQRGPTVNAAGQIARTGTLNAFVLGIEGLGLINADSTIRLELDGKFIGPHVLEGRLLPTGIITGTISGDHAGGDGIQVISLARHSDAPPPP